MLLVASTKYSIQNENTCCSGVISSFFFLNLLKQFLVQQMLILPGKLVFVYYCNYGKNTSEWKCKLLCLLLTRVYQWGLVLFKGWIRSLNWTSFSKGPERKGNKKYLLFHTKLQYLLDTNIWDDWLFLFRLFLNKNNQSSSINLISMFCMENRLKQ